jgi:TetR/AcrR family transcriptional regulator, ethionamide resistance regulator
MSFSIPPSPRLRAKPKNAGKIAKSDRTRADILDAALKFMWSRQFHEMTVNNLMASTGVGRSTFYQYFSDLHSMMEALLHILEDEISAVVQPWYVGIGDPVALLNETMTGLIRICYQRGPFLRAISDAATTDTRFAKDWGQFLCGFDDMGITRIAADQEQGLIPAFDPGPVCISLNRLNVSTMIEAFGQRPRSKPEPVRQALSRVWVSTLYGAEWVEQESSDLLRR